MPHRILEPLILAPVVSGLAMSSIPGDWTSVLIGPASGLAVSLFVLWFLKGYYDRSLSREAENRQDIREILERVITLAEKQHKQSERAIEVIEENSSLTRETKLLLKGVTDTITMCHEKHTALGR